jgi:hypothetical protein
LVCANTSSECLTTFEHTDSTFPMKSPKSIMSRCETFGIGYMVSLVNSTCFAYLDYSMLCLKSQPTPESVCCELRSYRECCHRRPSERFCGWLKPSFIWRISRSTISMSLKRRCTSHQCWHYPVGCSVLLDVNLLPSTSDCLCIISWKSKIQVRVLIDIAHQQVFSIRTCTTLVARKGSTCRPCCLRWG